MNITIDNNKRIFQVITSTGKQVFCNLEHLNQVVKDLGTHEGYFKIYHFWNNKAKIVSKKFLKEMFEANNIKQEFYY